MLKDELEKSRNFSGVLFIFALLAVYGGTTIPYGEGVWFHYESEFKGTDYGQPESSIKGFFLLEEVKGETEVKEAYSDTTDSDDFDESYDDLGYDEREELMAFTKNVATLTIIMAGALFGLIFGFLNGQFSKDKIQEYLDYSKNLCLGLIVICLFNAGHFALNYPEAWQDDTSTSLDTICGTEEGEDIPILVQFMGKCENKNTDQIIDGVTGNMKASWHPGIAWFVTLAVIPGLAFYQHSMLKGLEESNAFSEYKPAPKKKKKVSKRPAPNPPSVQQSGQFVVEAAAVVESSPVPEPSTKQEKKESKSSKKAVSKKKPMKFKPKLEQVDIECPSCGEIMQVPKLDKLQDVKCNACGLSGEIEV